MSRPPIPVDPYELTQRLIDNFPPDLLRLKHWALWGWNEHTQKKIICDRIDKPDTWGNFEEASKILINSPAATGFLFAVGNGVACVDLDDVLHNGIANATAQRIVDNVSSYTEISPSGTGLHILSTISNPSFGSKRHENIEVYTSKRWLCVTGDVYQSRKTLYEADGAISRLLASLERRKPLLKPLPLKKNEIPISDSDLLKNMFNSRNGDKIRLVWDCRSSHSTPSEGDMALICYLGYWTGYDVSRMKDLFLQSPRGTRDKAKREDYIDRMIEKVMEKR